MSSIKGTNVIAPVVPFDTTDAYPTHEAAYGRGGYRTVNTTSARDAIPSARREAGMLVCVAAAGVHTVYRLADDLTTWVEFSPTATWSSITGKPSTFPPSNHTHAVVDVTGLQASLDGKQPAGSYANLTHTHAAADVSGLAAVATSGSYADLTGRPSIPSPTTSASDLTQGTLADARLTANVVLTTDARLSNSRTPTSHAASHAAAGSDPLTLSASQVTGLSTVATSGSAADLTGTLADARLSANVVLTTDARLSDARTPTSHVHAAADITSGTLADARLSSNVVLASALADLRHQGSASLDVPDRATVGTSNTITSGVIYWAFFTPLRTITVSQIAYASGTTGATSVTLARLGLYTADSSGNATLVARTASDTTLSATGSTVYTRSLDTTGGYPATYTLSAGTRYGVALIVVASGAGSIATCNAQTSVSTLSPRIQGVRTGNSDLVTSQTSSQYNGSTSWIPWFRMS